MDTKIMRTYSDEDVFELFTNVARRLGFSRWHLRQLCEAGEFPPPIRLGKRRLAFRRADVQSWIRQRERADWRKPGCGQN